MRVGPKISLTAPPPTLPQSPTPSSNNILNWPTSGTSQPDTIKGRTALFGYVTCRINDTDIAMYDDSRNIGAREMDSGSPGEYAEHNGVGLSRRTQFS